MPPGAELTTVETVHEEGSWLFTVEDVYGEREEVLLVPCEDGVEAWVNICTHEAQRLDRGMGAMMRDGGIICPKHGSIFDGCSGDCDNGKAAGTTLVDVDVAVEDGQVYLTDDGRSFSHPGEADADDDDMPDSSSHLGF